MANTQYITSFVNEYGQINVYECLCKIHELVNYRFYHKADKMINELYELSIGTKFDNVNADLFFLTFSEETEMYLLINKIATKLYLKKSAKNS